MTEAAPAAATAQPAAPAAQPTHVTKAHTTEHQPLSPVADKPAEPNAAQPAVGDKPADEPKDPAKPQPEGDKPAEPAKPDDKPAEPDFKIPDEYKDKPWAAKVKSLDDLYKQIDTLDALKGKKSIVPNLKEATPEEREAFYSQLRGKDASEYPMPKNTTVPIPEDTQPAMAKLFMDNGVSPVQAQAILEGYLPLREKQIASHFEPEGFKSAMVTAFGSDWEQTTGAVRNTIKSMMSPDDQKQLDAIPNHMLGLVYRTLGNTIKAADETLKKYGATESFAHLQAPNGKVASTDLSSQRQGLRDQLAALSMRPHTAAEQQSIIDQLNKTYDNDPRLRTA